MDDTVLGTSRRTWLVRPPDEVLATRLELYALDADLVMDDRVRSVHFPASWPGDALPLVSNWLELRRSDRRGEPWGGTVVERATQRAIGTIGAIGCMAWPDGTGSVEVSYGIERARRGRGFAKESLTTLLDVLARHDAVRRVVAASGAPRCESTRGGGGEGTVGAEGTSAPSFARRGEEPP